MGFLLALLASLLAAIVPTMIYVALAWWLDRYEKEPLWLLSITFLWGAIPAIVVSLVAELVLDVPIQLFVTGQGAEVVSTALIAPVVEEGVKAIPLVLIFVFFLHEFDGLMDGLIYAALVGFGFSMTENFFYFLGAYGEGGWGAWSLLVFLRAIVFGLNHALFTSVLGAGLGYARYATRRGVRLVAPVVGLGGAIALHATHNLFVSLPTDTPVCLISLFADWLGVLVWLLLMFIAAQQEKEWIRQELREEVVDGVLPAEHAEAAARYRTRLRDRWEVWQEHGWGRAHRLSRLHHLAAELALKKRQLDLHGDERGNAAAVTRLRHEIRQVVGELG